VNLLPQENVQVFYSVFQGEFSCLCRAILCEMSPVYEQFYTSKGVLLNEDGKPIGGQEKQPDQDKNPATSTPETTEETGEMVHQEASVKETVMEHEIRSAVFYEGFEILFGFVPHFVARLYYTERSKFEQLNTFFLFAFSSFTVGLKGILDDVDFVDLIYAIHAARFLQMDTFLKEALWLFQRFQTLDGPRSWKALETVNE